MGQTDRWDIRYPEQGDEVDVPTDLAELAADVEGSLARAFRCTSSTRPGSPPNDMLIRETDTGDVRIWTGSTWALVGGGTGGGGTGGGGSVSGLWRAASAQSIPNTTSGPGTPIAFGTEATASAEVTRAAFGSGHTFELGSAGLWVGTFIGRWATTVTAGVRDFNIWCDQAGGADWDETLAHDGGGTVAGQPKGRTLTFSRVLAAGTKLAVYAYNGTGASRSLEHSAGDWVALDLHYLG